MSPNLIIRKKDLFKGIVIDSYNTCLWHKSEDINQKGLFSKYQFIKIFHVQVYMHDYMYIEIASSTTVLN